MPATEHSPDTQEIGIIQVDAVFSHVTRVRYEVEETRVGQKTNYDRLTLEIWTDGTITPEMALVEAAKILRKHLNPFVGYGEPGPCVHLSAGGGVNVLAIEAPVASRLGQLVSEIGLSTRAANALAAEGISTLRELVSLTHEHLHELRNAGENTVQEIEDKLAEHGLSLVMNT